MKDIIDERGNKQYDWIVNYVAKATLTLQVNSDGGVSPELSLIGPFNNGTFSFGVGGGITGQANRIATYGFIIDFKSAAKFDWCLEEQPPGHPPLQGDLGFREWFTKVLLSHDKNDPFPRPDSLSHRLEFIWDGNVRITPAYVLARSKGNALLGAHRRDLHSLDIALIYRDPKDPGYNKVCVVNLEGPCYVGPHIATVHAPRRKSLDAPGAVAPPPQVRAKDPPSLSPEDRQRLERQLQNLQFQSIQSIPRF
jgi:hypothetical protein